MHHSLRNLHQYQGSYPDALLTDLFPA